MVSDQLAQEPIPTAAAMNVDHVSPLEIRERSQYWNDIVRRVAQIERAVGTAVLENREGRDSMEGVSFRLAFLTGYLESKAEFERGSNMRDMTPEAEDDGGYETAGNLICLPGVSLSKVLAVSEGDRP